MRAAETAFLGRESDLAGVASSWRAGLAGAVVGALLAILALTGVPAARGVVDAAAGFASAATRPEAAPPEREWPRRPLPREWRWSPPGVDVRTMFRQPR